MDAQPLLKNIPKWMRRCMERGLAIPTVDLGDNLTEFYRQAIAEADLTAQDREELRDFIEYQLAVEITRFDRQADAIDDTLGLPAYERPTTEFFAAETEPST
jgi:ATP phosphoribosyltransferase regulatory subunit HisZ